MEIWKLGLSLLVILGLTWSAHANISPLLSLERNDQTATDPPPDTTKNITVVKAGFMGSKEPVEVTYRFLRTIGGKTIHSFLGIQYGEDPSGDKRFKKVGQFAPLVNQEKPNYDASEFPKKCPQMNGSVFDSTSAENCLYLNVYTNTVPDTNTNGTIPVMVYIHGGSFVSGDASQYKPDVLLDYNVILVTIQYRLGSLGFFTRLDNQMPGNVALWDQITALQWVQNNIEFLGGNKSHVTIFGHGAGAASVNYLLLLNGTSAVNVDGLFHAAIMEGGSALDVWALDDKPINSSRRFATANNCLNMTAIVLFTCMKNVSAANLTINLHKFIQAERANGSMGFRGVSPVVQRLYGVPNSDLLLRDTPDKLIRNRSHVMDIPVILGANKHEGSYSLGVIYRDFLGDKVNDEYYMRNQFLADILNSTGNSTGVVADLIKYDYIGDKDLANLTIASPGLIDLTGALYVKNGVWKAAEILAALTDRKEKVFFYSFDFESKDSLFDTYFPGHASTMPFDHGVTSGDELMYLFNIANTTFADSQNKTRDRLAVLWTNFASTRDPTPATDLKKWKNLGIPKWTDVDTAKHYLLIEKDCTIQEEYAKRRHIAFDEAYPPVQSDDNTSLKRQRKVFLAFMIIFLISTVGLIVTVFYIKSQ